MSVSGNEARALTPPATTPTTTWARRKYGISSAPPSTRCTQRNPAVASPALLRPSLLRPALLSPALPNRVPRSPVPLRPTPVRPIPFTRSVAGPRGARRGTS